MCSVEATCAHGPQNFPPVAFDAPQVRQRVGGAIRSSATTIHVPLPAGYAAALVELPGQSFARSSSRPEYLSYCLCKGCDRSYALFTMPEMERADGILIEVYKKAGMPERYRTSFYDGPQKFDREMQKEAFSWFDRWLKS